MQAPWSPAMLAGQRRDSAHRDIGNRKLNKYGFVSHQCSRSVIFVLKNSCTAKYSLTVIFCLTGTPWYGIFPIGNMNTTKNPEQLGASIRARRRQLKVTQKDLAMTCGTGLRFIIDLEKGKQTCQIGKILQVLNALGLELQIAIPGGDTGQGEKP